MEIARLFPDAVFGDPIPTHNDLARLDSDLRHVLVHVPLAATERLAREDDRDTEYASIVDHQVHVTDPVVIDAIQDDHARRFIATPQPDNLGTARLWDRGCRVV